MNPHLYQQTNHLKIPHIVNNHVLSTLSQKSQNSYSL